MGRLQRKKQVIKKKISKGDTDAASGMNKSGQAKQSAQLTDSSKNKKLQAIVPKKSSSISQSTGKWQGYLENTLQFFREVKIELKKVTWPSRNQTIGSTVVVILLVMIISLFLGLVDIGLSKLVQIVLN